MRNFHYLLYYSPYYLSKNINLAPLLLMESL